MSKESIARGAKDWSGVVKRQLMAESAFRVVGAESLYGFGMASPGDILASILPKGRPWSEVTERKEMKLSASPLFGPSLLM